MPDLSAWPESAHLRSGAVARLAGLPVTTLRVWERRYGVVAAPKSATGQRQYTAHDVQRLKLLKQLTDQGHAIGSIAALPLTALRAMMGTGASGAAAGPGLRALVVGRGLAQRLSAAGLQADWAVCDDLGEVEVHAASRRVDVLFVHLPSMQAADAERVRRIGARLPAATAIVYRYAATPVLASLRAAALALYREPVDGQALAHWLETVQAAAARCGPVAPRRYDDESLAALSRMASTVACECPRHLAEIVAQLAGLERYSAECGSQAPADAALHRELQALAGSARMRFEQALEHVAQAEGLALGPLAAQE